MTTIDEIVARARRRAAELDRMRALPRFQRVVGRLCAAGLLVANEPIDPFRGRLDLKDYLWAGELEPRIYELLPALVLKRPALFKSLDLLPEDLSRTIRDIKRGMATESFRGIPAQNYLAWLPRVGHRGKQPCLLKSFRFDQSDLTVLAAIKAHGYTEIDAVRQGLRLLQADLGRG